MKRLGTQPSQLKGCTMYRDSVGNECYALRVSREDLASSSLDVPDLTLGKYVIRWVREDHVGKLEADGRGGGGQELCAVSTYELQSVKVCQSSLYAEAKLPPYAVARTPFGVVYHLTNRTDIVQEFTLAMESSEAFMLSGNKQQHFKIPPGSTYDLNYVLYPLLAGEAVALPMPKLSSLRPALPHDDVGATLQRLLPSNITGMQNRNGFFSSYFQTIFRLSSVLNCTFFQFFQGAVATIRPALRKRRSRRALTRSPFINSPSPYLSNGCLSNHNA
jgi:hypothetical protein